MNSYVYTGYLRNIALKNNSKNSSVNYFDVKIEECWNAGCRNLNAEKGAGRRSFVYERKFCYLISHC